MESSENYKRLRQDSKEKPRPSIWRLLEASQSAEVFFPRFEDEQVHLDFLQDIKKGKHRKIYAQEFYWRNQDYGSYPKYAQKEKETHPFYYIKGKDLKITDTLLDSKSKTFQNEHKLRLDFIVFFSMFPGNPSPHPQRTSLNQKNSFVILIRGHLERLEEDLSYISTLSQRNWERPVYTLKRGDIWIQEVLYDPSFPCRDSSDEFIKIYNSTMCLLIFPELACRV